MLLKEIIQQLEILAPPSYQESYDNSGLLTGNPSQEIQRALVCLDSTEGVIDEQSGLIVTWWSHIIL